MTENITNKSSDLTKNNTEFVKIIAKIEKVSEKNALNKLVKEGFEVISSQYKEKNNKEAIEKKPIRHDSKISNKSSKLISIVTLITSIVGIFLGVIYVLYTKQ